MSASAALAGERLAFGEYRALRVLAKGGMGVVFEARHATLGTRVAVKAVDAARLLDHNVRRRFQREALTLSGVRHPHVVRVFEAVLEHDPPFLVMELLDGETLQALLRRTGRLSLERTLDWFAPILAAVVAIHDAGILHRDLKLGNVMLAREGGFTRPVIVDFGISKPMREELDELALTHSEALLGTPRYLSPEQMRSGRAASEKSDQYALGVMLYECLTGQHAFSGGSYYELMHAILHSPLRAPSALVPGLPARLERVIVRAMSRDAADRFDDVRALGAALLECASVETRARWQHAFVPRERPAPCEQDRTEVDERALLRPLQTATVSKRPIVRWGVLGVALAVFGLGAGFVRAGSRGPVPSPEPSAASPEAPGSPPPVAPSGAGQATSQARTATDPDPPSRAEAVPQARLQRSPARDTSDSTGAASSRSASIVPSRKTTKHKRAPTQQQQEQAVPRTGVAAPAELGRDDVVDPYL